MRAEPAAQQEVLAVGLFERLAQCGGFLAVPAFEAGELGVSVRTTLEACSSPGAAAGSGRAGRVVRWCSMQARMPTLR